VPPTSPRSEPRSARERRDLDVRTDALQRPIDQGASTAADHLAHRRLGQRGEAELANAALERERDLAGGVGERAVEVEDHRANRMHENRRQERV
jgi:hypothetical protein